MGTSEPTQALSIYTCFKCTYFQDSTHARTHTHTHTHTHIHCHISGQWDWRKGFWKEKGFYGRFKSNDRGRMTDRNNTLIPDGWSLETEGALTTGLCLEGWYSEHPGVCRKVELENDFDHWQVRLTNMTGHTDRHGSSGKSTWQLGCTCQTGQHDRSGRHTAGQACVTSHRSTWQVRHVTQIRYDRSGRSTWQARHIKQTWQVRQKNTTGQTAQHDRSDMSNRHDMTGQKQHNRSDMSNRHDRTGQTKQYDRSDRPTWQVRQTGRTDWHITGQTNRHGRSDQPTCQVRYQSNMRAGQREIIHHICIAFFKPLDWEKQASKSRAAVQRKSLTKQQWGRREKTDTEADKQPDTDPTFWTPRAGQRCRERVWPNNTGDGKRRQTQREAGKQPDTDPTFWTPRAGRSSAPAGRCSSWWFWPWMCPRAWAAVDTSTADRRNPPRLCIWDNWCTVKDNACVVVRTKFFPTRDTRTTHQKQISVLLHIFHRLTLV